jgi:hypothetical protein
LWGHSYVVAGKITTQPKQGRRAMPMSSVSIIGCLLYYTVKINQILMKICGELKLETLLFYHFPPK